MVGKKGKAERGGWGEVGEKVGGREAKKLGRRWDRGREGENYQRVKDRGKGG